MSERRGAVVTPGNYDGVHLGHRALLRETRAQADARDLRAVALFFDPHPARVLAPDHAPASLTTAHRRVELLRGAGADEAVPWPFDRRFAALSPESFIRDILVERLGARGVVVGPDFRFGRNRSGDLSSLQALGAHHAFDVTVVDPVVLGGERVSSTRVRERLAAGHVSEAAELLGRVHDVDGTVVEGDRRGRTIGFPTANLRCDPVALPGNGVYAVVARRLDRPGSPRLGGVANLGVRPTVGAGYAVEVHLFDFAEEVYGARMRVGFVARIRSERKLAGLDALKAQITQDAEAAHRALASAEVEEQVRWV